MTWTTLSALDLLGVFVFALSGALAAVRARLDFFGVIVIGTVTAIGGGLLRDLLLGATPPTALRDWQYLAVPAIGATLVFFWHPQIERLRRPMMVLDAAGLGLFTVTGTQKALDFGLGAAGACVLGVLTGIGGGMLRDVLLREIPLVLRREIYALAAAAGAALVTVGDGLSNVAVPWQIVAVVTVFGIRVVAIVRKWSLPPVG